MIFVASCFRNSTGYIDRWAAQIEALRGWLDVPVHTIAVEGDSEDDSYQQLHDCKHVDTLLKAEHGGVMFDSVVNPLRWRQLSVAGNAALCAAQRMSSRGDLTCYVESDLIWEPTTISRLADRLKRSTIDAVAPMSMTGGRFYDVWGHQKDGRMFSAHPPYYPGWVRDDDTMVPIDTAGSCFVLSDDALRAAEFSAIDCIRGIGRSLKAHRFQLWLDPTVEVRHP